MRTKEELKQIISLIRLGEQPQWWFLRADLTGCATLNDVPIAKWVKIWDGEEVIYTDELLSPNFPYEKVIASHDSTIKHIIPALERELARLEQME